MTQFGQNPSFNSFHFSGGGNFNQESIAAVGVTAPGRVTDLNVFWDGDGVSVTGNNMLWNSGGGIEIQSSSYSSSAGSESTGGQHLHTTSHTYWFTVNNNMFVGFFRDKTKSSVVSLNTGGTDGFTQTTSGNSPTSVVGHQSFNSVYGALGKGAMRAYGNYTPSTVYVRRSGVWVALPVKIRRSSTNSPFQVSVRRGSSWTPLNMIPVGEWDDPLEKEVLIVWDDNWEMGIIRDEGNVRFGNVDPTPDPRTDGSIKLVAV